MFRIRWGWTYDKKNVFGQAVSWLEKSAAQLPNNPIVQYHLGMAYHKKGHQESTERVLQKALQLRQNFPRTEEARGVLATLQSQ